MLTAEAAIERTFEDYQRLSGNRENIRACQIHVKVSHDGLLLTDSKRAKFFRKHYASDQISYCGYHQSAPITNSNNSGMKIIGIVSKKSASNTCVLLTTEDLKSSDDLIKYITMVNILLI